MSKRDTSGRSEVFSSLLGEIRSLQDDGVEQRNIALSQIGFNPKQPRKYIDEAALAALTDSVKQHGVLEPILVRSSGDAYELIAGERRTRAAQIAGLESIPAVILELTEAQALEVSIIENLQREDLNPVEETDAVLRLLGVRLEKDPQDVLQAIRQLYDESRGRVGNNVISNAEREQIEALFSSVGRFTPSSFHTNRVPLLRMPPDLIEAVRTGKLHYTKARKLARIRDAGVRQKLLTRVLSEGLSVEELDQEIQTAQQVNQHETKAYKTVRLLKSRLSTARLENLNTTDKHRAFKLLEELNKLLG